MQLWLQAHGDPAGVALADSIFLACCEETLDLGKGFRVPIIYVRLLFPSDKQPVSVAVEQAGVQKYRKDVYCTPWL